MRPLAEDLPRRMGAVALEVSKRAQLEIPELFPDETWVEVQLSSVEGGLRNVARTIAEGTDPGSIELPLETVAYARAAARQGFAVTSLMRLYQLAQAALWEELQRELSVRAASQEELTDAHGLVTAWIFGYIDTAMGLAIDAYTKERARWLRSAAARQAEMIDAILSGRQTDAAVAGAAIRYELEREHIAVAAWLEEAPKDVDAAIPLEAAISEVGEALGAGGILTQPRGLLATFGWVSTTRTFDPELLEGSLLADAANNGVRLAIGEAGRGIRGFRESHEGAENARRVAVLQGRPPGSVTRYARVALAALGTADRAQAQAFVIRQLGPLTAPDETSVRLVATLRAYLDEHASRSRAAKRLGVHENTISYRVRQAEEILGRSVDEETLELHVALVLAPVVLDV